MATEIYFHLLERKEGRKERKKDRFIRKQHFRFRISSLLLWLPSYFTGGGFTDDTIKVSRFHRIPTIVGNCVVQPASMGERWRKTKSPTLLSEILLGPPTKAVATVDLSSQRLLKKTDNYFCSSSNACRVGRQQQQQLLLQEVANSIDKKRRAVSSYPDRANLSADTILGRFSVGGGGGRSSFGRHNNPRSTCQLSIYARRRNPPAAFRNL